MLISSLKVPFGKKNGLLYDVHSVEKGLLCKCVCPSCDMLLIANHCTKKQSYFSHSKGSDCAHGYETSIHEMSKQILLEARSIILPELVCRINEDSKSTRNILDITLLNEQIWAWKDIGNSEIFIQNIKPDFFVNTSQGDLLIEIAVTHFCDEKKLQKLKSLNFAAIEIDLSNCPRIASKEDLRHIIINELEGKSWLSYPGLIDAKKEIEKIRTEIEVNNEKNRIAIEKEIQINQNIIDIEFNLEQQKKRSLRRLKENTLKDKQIKIAQNNKNFKDANITNKQEFILNKLELIDKKIPTQINTIVRFEDSFCVPRWIWQGDIFRRFILKEKISESDRELSLESLSHWMNSRYVTQGKFPTSYKIALWDYLLFLRKQGYIDKKMGQKFFIKRSFW